jgi:hypothetical protein
MTVFADDFIPIQPYTTESVTLTVGTYRVSPFDKALTNIGQRLMVVVTADQAVANYYFRIGTGGGLCDGPNEQATAGNTKGAIVTYAGAGTVTPTSTPLTLPSGCGEETQLVPFVAATVPPPNGNYHLLNLTLDTTAGVFWKVNGMAQDIDWSTPSLSYVMNGTYTLPPQDNGITLNEAGWVYLLIINNTPLPHPVHLHGHDFFVLAMGTGDGSDAQLNLSNPMRRDTHSVDGNNGQPGPGGYLIVAFQADNPGAWLLHCHIPFHISGGLGVQFLERPSEILGSLGDISLLEQGCAAWGALQAGANTMQQPDSGLKRRRRWVAPL